MVLSRCSWLVLLTTIPLNSSPRCTEWKAVESDRRTLCGNLYSGHSVQLMRSFYQSAVNYRAGCGEAEARSTITLLVQQYIAGQSYWRPVEQSPRYGRTVWLGLLVWPVTTLFWLSQAFWVRTYNCETFDNLRDFQRFWPSPKVWCHRNFDCSSLAPYKWRNRLASDVTIVMKSAISDQIVSQLTRVHPWMGYLWFI